MKNEILPKLVVKTKSDTQKLGGHWYRGNTCNFIPTKKHFLEKDFFDNYILKGYKPSEPFIDKEKKIIAFGSCFAQHVSEYLYKKKYSTFVKKVGIDTHIIRYGEGMANTFTVLEQLLWVFENKNIEENTWYYSPDNEVRKDKNVREQTLNFLKQTDVLIITVGLSEIWYNKINNQVFWKAIPANKFDEKKHGFRLSTVEENTKNLEKIYFLINKHLPKAKVVFTLSPIPLMATFRPQSCITANSISKSILRVALDNLMTKNSDRNNLYYFPSYEITKEFFIDPFKEDNTHLKEEFIMKIMEIFEKNYCL